MTITLTVWRNPNKELLNHLSKLSTIMAMFMELFLAKESFTMDTK